MKVYVATDDGVAVELSDPKVSYSPDVLEDWCRCASDLIGRQRMLTLSLVMAHGERGEAED